VLSRYKFFINKPVHANIQRAFSRHISRRFFQPNSLANNNIIKGKHNDSSAKSRDHFAFTLLRQEALWLAKGKNNVFGFAGFRKDSAFAARSIASAE
jgi:hypothetical protein